MNESANPPVGLSGRAPDAPALRAIGWPFDDAPDAPPLPDAWIAARTAHPQSRPARVTAQHRSGYIVTEAPDAGVAAESLPQWQRASTPPEQRPAVGDWVLVEGNPAQPRIVALLPRYSSIKRGAAGEHYRQQVVAANVDIAFVVCGLDADFNPRRIERYLLLVGSSGVQPVVVLTKADKPGSDAAAAQAALRSASANPVPVIALNAKDRDAATQALAPWLAPGITAVLVGSSGAGKSTLTNTLLGIDKHRTGAVRETDARGRHTTTHRALVPLPSGACLIDTPGMRELKPTGEEDVADAFADIAALAAQCRFRDCRHGSEPACAVRAAVEVGTLDPQRLANYRKLHDEVDAAADQLATRQTKKADAKVQGKALNKRLDEKYGRH